MPSANLQVVISAKDLSQNALKGIAGDIDQIGKHATSSTSLIGGFTKALGSIGLAAMGISAIGGAVQGLIGDAVEAEKVQSQLNAVLLSTHGVSGMTADAVNALSDSLSKVTPFEDEAIGSAQNMLLTFTNIGKDVFPGATEAVLNMSQALGQDLQTSSIQLGKALNDPVAGVTALQRVGVKLTDSQKELVKTLVESGDVMGAQKVILGELQTEFGGAARAAGETFAGKMTILNTQIGNVKEAIGGPLLTAISGLITGITPAISAFATGLPDGIAEAQAAMKDFAGEVSRGNLIGAFAGLREQIAAALGPLIDLNALGENFRAWVAPASGALSALVGVLTAAAVAYALVTAAATAQAVVLGVQTLATNIAAAAQLALNLVMTANPIGLVIVAIAGLVAAFVTLYETNTTFREIVDKTFASVKATIGEAVAFISERLQGFIDLVNSVASSVQALVTAVNSIPQSIQLPEIPNLFGASPSPSYGPSPTGGVTNNSTNAPTINVHVNGDNADPTVVQNNAKAGVLAANRALGYS